MNAPLRHAARRFREARFGNWHDDCTARTVLYGGPRSRGNANVEVPAWEPPTEVDTVAKPARRRYRSGAEARVGRTGGRDQTPMTLARRPRERRVKLAAIGCGCASPRTRLSLEPPYQNIDQVLSIRRLEAVLTQHAHEVLPRKGAIVGADEHSRDGSLDVHRRRDREQARQLIEAFAVGKVVVRQCIERADLRIRFGHA